MQVFQEQQSTNSKRGLSNNIAPSPKRWGENVDTSNRRCYIISRNKKRDRSYSREPGDMRSGFFY